MKEQIYQNGFYALIGLIIGFIIACCFFKPSETPLKTETQKDTVVIHDTVYKAKTVSLAPSKAAVKEELKKQNLKHPEIVLAQSRLETGEYTSEVCKKYNNLFGLRKGNAYRKYNHWTESVTAYKELIQSRYNGGDYYQFLRRIKYAEDPAYIDKVKNLV